MLYHVLDWGWWRHSMGIVLNHCDKWTDIPPDTMTVWKPCQAMLFQHSFCDSGCFKEVSTYIIEGIVWLLQKFVPFHVRFHDSIERFGSETNCGVGYAVYSIHHMNNMRWLGVMDQLEIGARKESNQSERKKSSDVSPSSNTTHFC